MKLFSSKIANYKWMLLLFLLTGILSSCLKDRDYVEHPVAKVNVVNASPKSPFLEFSFDQNRLDMKNFGYKYYTGYLDVYPGNRSFKVYKNNTSTALFTKDIALENKKHYSIFIVDTLSKMETVLLRDSSRAAGADSVRIRFANMSPDVAAMDFYIQGKAEAVATNISYKNAGEFFSLKAASDVVFEVKAAGQSTVLGTSEKKNLHDRAFYTIWSSGFKSQTDEAKIFVGAVKH